MSLAHHRLVAVVALAAVALSLALALPAIGANHTNTTDGNDTDGMFDLEAIALDHYPGPLEWTFRTFAGWSVDEMWDRGYLVVELDTRGDTSIDARIVVRSDGRALVATLFSVRADGNQREVATLRAMKDSRRAAGVEVALRRLAVGRSREAFHWYALSLFSGASCRRVCFDRVPDEGRLEQPLPGVTPNPSPTPTATPTPTGPTGES